MPDDETRSVTVPREGDDAASGQGNEPRPEDGDGAALSDEFESPIVPGSPSAESVLFVLLGVFGALAVLLRLVQLFA